MTSPPVTGPPCEWPTSESYTGPDPTCGRSARWVVNRWEHGKDPGPDTLVCGSHRRTADGLGWMIRPLEQDP